MLGYSVNYLKTRLELFVGKISRRNCEGRGKEIPDHLRAQNTRKHMKDSFIHPLLLLVQIVHSSNQV
ncbi:hypothetical protein ACJIZ3_017989 [Penstemon smallii]|uniref:Uncharacterized protein n=1 Tax=Penstemon smallii TaxID=265156 RepID=A0ABD3SX35_9LAMI